MLLSQGSFGDTWNVVHTRTRHELRLEDSCKRLGLKTYLPLVTRKIMQRRRILESVSPLFPGYLFVCMKRENRLDIYRNGHIINILEVFDQNGLLKDLNEIEKAIQREASLEPFSYLKRGKRARIIDGPFRGIEGIISHRRGKFRVVLNVDIIAMATAIEVDAHQVELKEVRRVR